jgi:hypothetical protein
MEAGGQIHSPTVLAGVKKPEVFEKDAEWAPEVRT